MNWRAITFAYLCGCFAVLVVACALYAVQPWIELRANLTHSLPDHLYLVIKGERVERGNLVAFRWHGGAGYPAGETFIKIVAGVPGDTVQRTQSTFYVAGGYAGTAKTTTQHGAPLLASQAGVLGQGEYFVSAPNPHSLDSRYAIVGWVKQNELVGRAYALF